MYNNKPNRSKTDLKSRLYVYALGCTITFRINVVRNDVIYIINGMTWSPSSNYDITRCILLPNLLERDLQKFSYSFILTEG